MKRLAETSSYLKNIDIGVSFNISVPGCYLVFCHEIPGFSWPKFNS